MEWLQWNADMVTEVVMDKSEPSEPAKRIAFRVNKYKAEWVSRWGHLYEEFQAYPTTETAVDLLTFTNPPASVVDELRDFLIKPPQKPRGRPKSLSSDMTALLFFLPSSSAITPK